MDCKITTAQKYSVWIGLFCVLIGLLCVLWVSFVCQWEDSDDGLLNHYCTEMQCVARSHLCVNGSLLCANGALLCVNEKKVMIVIMDSWITTAQKCSVFISLFWVFMGLFGVSMGLFCVSMRRKWWWTHESILRRNAVCWLVSSETYQHTQKRPINTHKRDLSTHTKETYQHTQKRPINTHRPINTTQQCVDWSLPCVNGALLCVNVCLLCVSEKEVMMNSWISTAQKCSMVLCVAVCCSVL